jgi:electron transfer flavoprotein alpha subunit
MINPYDSHALTEAIRIRERFGGEVAVLTMGPALAAEALGEALAMGTNRAVHLLGREFAGADTLATARALAQACRKLGFDLVLCGKSSIDSDTAQIPAMVAELLDVPQVTSITHLEWAPDQTRFAAERELDDGFETVEGCLPAVLSVGERINKAIRVKPEDCNPASLKPIEVWSAHDLGVAPTQLGAAGSPTWVAELRSHVPQRRRRIRGTAENLETAIIATVQDLLAEGLFGNWRVCARPLVRTRNLGARERAIWVVAERLQDRFRPVTFELLGCGAELAAQVEGEVAAVLIGADVADTAGTLAAYGADRVYLAEAPGLRGYATELYAEILVKAVRRHQPFAVLLPSTSNGRDLAPRVAARLNAGLTGDCIGLEIDAQGNLVQLKPALGGNVVASILTHSRPVMATVRAGMLPSVAPDDTREVVVERLPVEPLPIPRVTSRGLRIDTATRAGIGLETAGIIVGAGTGIGGPEHLPALQPLLDVLDGALGATRKVVDKGWLPRQLQIGLTGRAVSPHLYVAVGISGRHLHRVGIQHAGIVLAINSDPRAEIFEDCDYGLVGDWRQVVPALVHTLRLAKASRGGRSDLAQAQDGRHD